MSRILAFFCCLLAVACSSQNENSTEKVDPLEIPDLTQNHSDAQPLDDVEVADGAWISDGMTAATNGSWNREAGSSGCDQFPSVTSEFRPVGGTSFGDVAGEFAVSLMDGYRWQFSEIWSGCESYLFFTYFDISSSIAIMSDELWNSRVDELFLKSAPNLHYFFMSDQLLESDRVNRLLELRARIYERIDARLGEQDRRYWKSRFHFVVDRASSIEGSIGDFLRDYLSYASTSESAVDLGDRGLAYPPLPFVFGIDRFQRFDSVGSLSTAVGRPSALSMAAYTASFYNHMAQIQHKLTQAPPDISLELLSGLQTERHLLLPLDLPGHLNLNEMTTATVDLQVTCQSKNPFGCSEWDRIGRVLHCRDEACEDANEITRWITPYWRRGTRRWLMDITPFLPLLSGMNPATGDDTAGPTSDSEGFHEDDVSDAGLTQPDALISHLDASTDLSGAHDANASTDFDVPDLGGDRGDSGLLLSTSHGFIKLIMGPEWERKTSRDVQFKLHFGQGLERRARHVFPLFSGGAFDASFDNNQPVVTFEVPSDMQSAKLTIILSGHGQETPDNCAEWCPHRHVFTVNDHAFDVSPQLPQPTSVGCALLTGEGVVPGQWGNWSQGRAYWCPGFPVPRLDIDITEHLQPGALNRFEHFAIEASGGLLGGTIELSSYVVIY